MTRNIFKWTFRMVLGLILILFLFGTIKQCKYDSKVNKEHKPSGDFSDIGHNKLHFKYTGAGDFTFVLIAGLGETMNTWSAIEHELQKRGKVFTYDRSGLGHSEMGIVPRSIDNLSKELHTVLNNEGIQQPYVIIGHSVGGFIARYYAKKYPQEVIGLFLIDPYQEMSKETFGEWPTSYKILNWSLRNLSWSGIPYFLLPIPPHPIYKTSKAIKTYGLEAYAEDISLKEYAKIDKEASNLPIYVLTADNPKSAYNDNLKKGHRDILAKYSNGINKHIAIESGHHIHIEKPATIIESLDEFLAKITIE